VWEGLDANRTSSAQALDTCLSRNWEGFTLNRYAAVFGFSLIW